MKHVEFSIFFNKELYYVREVDFIALVTIYSKTEREDISPEKIKALIEKYMSSG